MEYTELLGIAKNDIFTDQVTGCKKGEEAVLVGDSDPGTAKN